MRDPAAPEPCFVTNTETIGVPGKEFRAAVAVNGDWAACATPFGEALAEVFHYSAGEWRFHARLAAPGFLQTVWLPSMAMSGDHLWIGVPHSHRVVVFVRRGVVWSYDDTLMAPDGWRDSKFGERMVAAGGALYVNGWSGKRCGTVVYPRQEILFGADESVAHSVSVEGDNLFLATGQATWSGDVHWFGRTDDRWKYASTLDTGRVATAVALDGDRLMVTGRFRPGKTAATAHWYRRDGQEWTRECSVTLPEFEGGHRVVFRDDISAVAFPQAIGGEGRVCVLKRDGVSWRIAFVLTAPAARSGDRFGDAISFDGRHLMIGAPGAVQGGGCGFLYRIGDGV